MFVSVWKPSSKIDVRVQKFLLKSYEIFDFFKDGELMNKKY